MDLTAYMQIDDLEKIAEENDIVVPRLRGYRLMKDEEPISKEELKKLMDESEITVCERLCTSVPFWDVNPTYHEYSDDTDRILDQYLVGHIKEGHYSKTYTEIRWDRIHGWKRKRLKYAIKKMKRQIQKQFELWNKYAGKEGMLYIHARIGGRNWDYYDGNELVKTPWFLDKVDDYYDDTYCDIYAKIK